MSRCLRCNQPCSTTATYCDSCRSLLTGQAEQREQYADVDNTITAPVIAVSPLASEALQTNRNGDASALFFHSSVSIDVSSPEERDYRDVVEQTLWLLNDAARRIESFRQAPKWHLRPTRLAHYRDISSEIQRQSTPLPHTTLSGDLSERIAAIWPWLDNEKEAEQDAWSSYTDPLAMRELPGPVSTQIVERHHFKTKAKDHVRLSQFSSHLRRRFTPTRLLVYGFALCILLSVIVGGALTSQAFLRPRATSSPSVTGSPTLTLSQHKANYSQLIHIYILHFSATTFVFLTRDTSRPIKTDMGDALIRVDRTGSRDVTLSIDGTWSPGLHTLEAEDTNTHYTASVTLQVASGSASPAHLDVSSASLNFGADMQGSNTTQALTLYNDGSGTISWSASSNQPWLMAAPTRGSYSDSQFLMVGVQRAHLAPGSYSGILTIATDIGSVQRVQVTMVVRQLPSSANAVLSLTPAVIAFTARDSATNVGTQFLAMNNPGTQTLYWSLASNQPSAFSEPLYTSTKNWLTLEQTTGTIAPGTTSMIRVRTYSQRLLPGVYIDTLVFNASPGHTILNTPQKAMVTLTVQSQCGVNLGNGALSFTTVSGQDNPGNQTLSLTAGSSCAGFISWQASSVANWLTITPAAGQLAFGAQATMTIGVNTTGLKPATYNANIAIVAGPMSQTVAVQLLVQAPPLPAAPIMAVSPLNLSFSTSQGQGNSPGQVVTITNTGKSVLVWQAIANAQSTSWLSTYPAHGTTLPGASTQVTVNVNGQNLTPGIYTGQILLSGSNANNAPAAGNPQTIVVNFTILAPCALAQLSTSSLVFNVAEKSTSATPLTMALTATGACNWPLMWRLRVLNQASWLSFSARAGSLAASGQPATLSLFATITGLKPGSYTAHVVLESSGSDGLSVPGSPQAFTVTLNITQSCALRTSASGLSFTAARGQSPIMTQNLTVSQFGNCGLPISWVVSGDAQSSSWLVLKSVSGKNSATVAVSINAQGLAAGTHKGAISIMATQSDGNSVPSTPIVVPVTLAVV